MSRGASLDDARDDLRRQIGDPKKLDRELRAYRKSAQTFSSSRPRLIEKYSKQWVAVHEGKVKVAAKTFGTLLEEIEKQRLPRESLIVRFIDKDERAMIL